MKKTTYRCETIFVVRIDIGALIQQSLHFGIVAATGRLEQFNFRVESKSWPTRRWRRQCALVVGIGAQLDAATFAGDVESLLRRQPLEIGELGDEPRVVERLVHRDGGGGSDGGDGRDQWRRGGSRMRPR